MIIMSEKKEKPVDEVYIRSYPKVIFMYPLLITSFVLWLLQMLVPTPVAWYGNIWLIVFFINMFIVAFDFSSTKFFVLILVVVVVVLLLVFLVPEMFAGLGGGTFNPGLTAEFYVVVTIIMAFVLVMYVILSCI